MAGGFAAGFGSAFAQSFNQQTQNDAQHNEDAFRLQYQDYISQRDYRQKMDLENKKNLRVARSIVAATGAPPETVSYAYDQLTGGADPMSVQKYLTENQAVVTKNTNTTQPGAGATASDAQPADPRDSLTQSAQSSVDSQMKSSGLKAPASGGIFGDIKQGIHNVFHSGAPTAGRQSNARTQEIADASGTTAQNVQDTLGGNNMPGDPVDGMPNASVKFVPKGATFEALRDKANNLGDAQALAVWTENNGTPEQKNYANTLLEKYKLLKANEIRDNGYALDPSKAPQRGMVRNPDGSYQNQFVTPDYSQGYDNPVWKDAKGNVVDAKSVAPIGPAQEKDMQGVANEGSDDLKTYDQAKNDQKNFIRTASDYIKLLKDTNGKYDGKVMDLTGDVSQVADRVRRAVVNIADLVSPRGEVPDANVAIASLDKTEKALRDELMSGKLVDRVSINAAKATLVDIQGTKLAYQMAAQANGSTKGISNKDFENYKNVVAGGGNPQTAAKALQMSIQQGNQSIADMEKNVKTGRGAAAYYKQKYPGAPTGFDMGKDFNTESAEDPTLAEALKNINADAGVEDNPGQQVDTTPNVPDWAQKATKPILDFKGEPVLPGAWKYMSPELQEYLKKKNGL